MNVEKGFFRSWLVVVVIWVSVLACYTSCDGDYIMRYHVVLGILAGGAACWAIHGFRA